MRRLALATALLLLTAAPGLAGITVVPRYKVGGNTTPAKHYLCTSGSLITDVTGMAAGDTAYVASNTTLYFYDGSTWQVPQTIAGTLLFTQTADGTVGNGTGEGSLLNTGTGSLTLPTNFWVVGRTIRFTACGYITNTGTPTLRIRLKLGSVVVYDTGAMTTTTITNTRFWFLSGYFTCRTTGATGTVIGQANFSYGTSNIAANRCDQSSYSTSNTVDTTGTMAVDLTAQWGTTNAANTLTCQNFIMEAIN